MMTFYLESPRHNCGCVYALLSAYALAGLHPTIRRQEISDPRMQVCLSKGYALANGVKLET